MNIMVAISKSSARLGKFLTIREVANELARRLTRIFLLDEFGRRPVFNDYERRLPIRIFEIIFFYTSTFMATTAAELAHRTKPAGPVWLPISLSRIKGSSAMNATIARVDDRQDGPIFGTLAQMTGTMFINWRSKTARPEHITTIGAALNTGLPIVLFPEGTSSDALPFCHFEVPAAINHHFPDGYHSCGNRL
jgi:hypothetical protein